MVLLTLLLLMGNGNNAYDNVVVNSPVKIDLPSQNRIRRAGGWPVAQRSNGGVKRSQGGYVWMVGSVE